MCATFKVPGSCKISNVKDFRHRRTVLARPILTAIICFVAITPLALNAKRMNPKPVRPVVYNGIEYSAAGDGKVQYVLATDSLSGKLLWKVKVFRTHIKPWVEEDTQWVFISDLSLLGTSLLVKDESSRCHLIDLRTRHVKKTQCP